MLKVPGMERACGCFEEFGLACGLAYSVRICIGKRHVLTQPRHDSSGTAAERT